MDMSDQTDSIFCTTCLKNQYFVTESLKNFEFPDDPTSPEYVERERNYRRWKRDLEQRHPQVCVDCEPKVQEQLRKASYNAKTDHLRRMMDRTRAQRREAKKLTKLDVIDTVGKWTWNMAFFLQFAWHLLVVLAILPQLQADTKDEHWSLTLLRRTIEVALQRLPSTSRVIRASVNMSLASFLWNSKFKQTIRGFTAHILGIRQWYTYQLVLILIRCVCLFISQYTETKVVPATTQLGAHTGIAVLMFYVGSARVGT
jgi:hypothetical protein